GDSSLLRSVAASAANTKYRHDGEKQWKNSWIGCATKTAVCECFRSFAKRRSRSVGESLSTPRWRDCSPTSLIISPKHRTCAEARTGGGGVLPQLQKVLCFQCINSTCYHSPTNHPTRPINISKGAGGQGTGNVWFGRIASIC